jgi:hypothetical protein
MIREDQGPGGAGVMRFLGSDADNKYYVDMTAGEWRVMTADNIEVLKLDKDSGAPTENKDRIGWIVKEIGIDQVSMSLLDELGFFGKEENAPKPTEPDDEPDDEPGETAADVPGTAKPKPAPAAATLPGNVPPIEAMRKTHIGQVREHQKLRIAGSRQQALREAVAKLRSKSQNQ